MIAGYYLVVWAMFHIVINTFLWGLAGAAFFKFFSCPRSMNFHIKIMVLAVLYYFWNSVVFDGLITQLDLQIGNKDLAEYLGFSDISGGSGLGYFVLSYVQMLVGYVIGEKWLQKLISNR